ncbi:MAG: hypothetical protein E7231_17020 [Cellulosilyticum sp.]|nr:hypothetical protein [Cellulosilyticum sp.]
MNPLKKRIIDLEKNELTRDDLEELLNLAEGIDEADIEDVDKSFIELMNSYVVSQDYKKMDLQAFVARKGLKFYKNVANEITRNEDYILKVINKYRISLCKENVYLIGTPHYANLGDQAIYYGEHAQLERLFPDKNIVEIFGDEFSIVKYVLYILIQSGEIIFLQGGGNMGDRYLDEESIRRDVAKLFTQNLIISYPQTVYYENSSNGKIQLNRSRRVINANKNYHILARDKVSYDFLKENFIGTVGMLPDVALTMKYDKDNDRNGILCCFRNDSETKITNEQRNTILEYLSTIDTIKETDTVLGEYLPLEQREAVFKSKLDEFASAKMVVTDRLHGMIFAAISGTPCIVLSNYNHKVRTMYELIKDKFNGEFLEEPEEIQTVATRVYNCPTVKWDNTEFVKAYDETIKRIIDNYKVYSDVYLIDEEYLMSEHWEFRSFYDYETRIEQDQWIKDLNSAIEESRNTSLAHKIRNRLFK